MGITRININRVEIKAQHPVSAGVGGVSLYFSMCPCVKVRRFTIQMTSSHMFQPKLVPSITKRSMELENNR